ncbi:hypothetical protein ACFQ3A_25575, partial [Sphaerisporangium aureirubrum]
HEPAPARREVPAQQHDPAGREVPAQQYEPTRRYDPAARSRESAPPPPAWAHPLPAPPPQAPTRPLEGAGHGPAQPSGPAAHLPAATQPAPQGLGRPAQQTQPPGQAAQFPGPTRPLAGPGGQPYPAPPGQGPAAPSWQQGGAGTPPTWPGANGERPSRRGPLISGAAAAAVLVVAGGGYLIAQNLSGGPGGVTASGTPGPQLTPERYGPSTGRSADAGSDTPQGSASPGGQAGVASRPADPGATPPPATRQIKLPDSTITVHENDADPIKLTAYSLDYGKQVYIRHRGENVFLRTRSYFEYIVSDDGRMALATKTLYTRDHYSTVALVDRADNRSSTIKIAKAPVYPIYPQWSPDGTKVLVSLNKAVGDSSEGWGFAIVDIARKRAKVVHITEKDVGRWSYFWRGDGQAVGTWAIKGSTERIRFYDLNGTVLQTLLDVGSPLTVEGDDVSPAGTQFMTSCTGTDEICVWSANGEERARIPFASERLIGWYDEWHIAGWRKTDDGYEAVVFDFKGQVSRLLATAKAGEYKKQYLRYTRGV